MSWLHAQVLRSNPCVPHLLTTSYPLVSLRQPTVYIYITSSTPCTAEIDTRTVTRLRSEAVTTYLAGHLLAATPGGRTRPRCPRSHRRLTAGLRAHVQPLAGACECGLVLQGLPHIALQPAIGVEAPGSGWRPGQGDRARGQGGWLRVGANRCGGAQSRLPMLSRPLPRPYKL